MNAIKFFNEVKQELSKVTWLTRKETLMSTVMVVVVVLVVSLLFVFVDFVIFNLIKFILNLGA
jgi:preprotein translocase subunit SecE